MTSSASAGPIGSSDAQHRGAPDLRAARGPELLWELLDSLRDAHVLLDPVRDVDGTIVDFVFTEANAAACAFNGMTREQLVGRRMLDLHPAVVASGLFDLYVRTVETGEPFDLDDFVHAQDLLGGMVRVYEVHGERVRGMVSQTWRDVQDAHDARAALAAAENKLRLLVENTMDLVLSLDTKAVIDWISPSVERMLGYRDTDLIGTFAGPLINADDLPELLDCATRARAGEPVSCRVRMVTVEGRDLWVEITPRPLYDDTGTIVGGTMAVRDVDAEVRVGQALQRELAFDSLTGLSKSGKALERIRGILRSRTTDGWALLCVGVHGLTVVNQAYTYTAGDAVLRVVADRLVAAAGAHDRVARIAGDEFAVMLDDLVTPAAAAAAAERLLAAVVGSLDLDGTRIEIDACVGIATSEPGDDDADALVRDATAALKRASARGPDRWEFADGEVADRTRASLMLQADLKDALAEKRIRAWFMPIVDLATGATTGYEALARWVRADGETIPPDLFLPVAERSNLILDIDHEVLTQSLEVLATLGPAIAMSVNVSAATLARGSLVEDVRRELARTGVDPARLALEVTETALLEVTPAVAGAMADLADLGVAWWVDDFGTGFSSISHLRDLPISGLKLDRGFTAGLESDSRDLALASGLCGMAAGLGLLTVAEGVETVAQANTLRDLGWHCGQGWLYGRPAPTAERGPAG